MNILADLHHLSLYNSLSLLFEKRLGHNLFRPIGMEWHEQGFWNIYPSIDRAKYWLSLEQGYEGVVPVNDYVESAEGIYVCKDYPHHSTQKALTLEAFKALQIDLVIASVPQHINPFKKLIREYHPNAKFIFQMGNMYPEVINNQYEIPNLLASTISFPVPPTCNAVFYHQAFDTTVFKPLGVPAHKKITSFIHGLYGLSETFYAHEYYLLKALLPEYDVKSYGGLSRGSLRDDGLIVDIEELAYIMNESKFGWHAKRWGDGFGHVLYNWYACGRPVITHLSDYNDKIGGELLEDMETCIDLDRHSLREVRDLIRHIPDDKYDTLCQQAVARFHSYVNYDEEEQKIRTFLDNLR